MAIANCNYNNYQLQLCRKLMKINLLGYVSIFVLLGVNLYADFNGSVIVAFPDYRRKLVTIINDNYYNYQLQLCSKLTKINLLGYVSIFDLSGVSFSADFKGTIMVAFPGYCRQLATITYDNLTVIANINGNYVEY